MARRRGRPNSTTHASQATVTFSATLAARPRVLCGDSADNQQRGAVRCS
jgi:hypothetical protein